MTNDVIKTGLCVKSVMTGDVEPTGQSRAVSRIYTRLESGDFGIVGACRALGLCKSESPIVVIEMVQSEHGFGFVYVNLCGDECPRVLVSGLLDFDFDLPMPVPPLGNGCINVMRAGYVQTTHSLEDVFGPIVANCDQIDFHAIRPGWDLDVKAILKGSEEVISRRAQEGLWMDFNPGDN